MDRKIISILLAMLILMSMSITCVYAGDAKAEAVNFSVRTYNTLRTEDGQTIETTIVFDKEIVVKDGAENDLLVKVAGATLNNMPNTENGQSNRTLSVKADPIDAKKLIITIGSKAGAQFVKQTNARLEIEAEKGISHILTKDTLEPVDLNYIDCVIPCGLKLLTVSSNAGTDTSVASVRKQVTSRSNVRSMVYIQILKNGNPLLPVEKFDHKGSYVIHAHAFINTVSGDTVIPELTETDYAKLICDGFNNIAKGVKGVEDKYKISQDGDKITLSAVDPVAGETLDINIFNWPNDDSKIAESSSLHNGKEQNFQDVTGWEKEYVYYLVNKGILEGRSDKEFAPAQTVTRAEFIKMLSKIEGTRKDDYSGSSFKDVRSSDWYAPYVEWASKIGIAKGSDGYFNPSARISKQDMAVMIQRYTDRVAKSVIPAMESRIVFTDDIQIASYAKTAVYSLQQAGIVSGDINSRFLPTSNVTRAQAAKMLAVYLQVTNQ